VEHKRWKIDKFTTGYYLKKVKIGCKGESVYFESVGCRRRVRQGVAGCSGWRCQGCGAVRRVALLAAAAAAALLPHARLQLGLV